MIFSTSLFFSSRSGSGKSCNVKHVLNYYAATTQPLSSSSTGGPPAVLSPDKVAAAFVLLEAFGNSRTVINANATRFSSLFSLDFDAGGYIASASVQVMMLDKTRVVGRRPEGEPNFNVFYQMLAGLDAKFRRELQLENLNEPNLFMTPLQREREEYAIT